MFLFGGERTPFLEGVGGGRGLGGGLPAFFDCKLFFICQERRHVCLPCLAFGLDSFFSFFFFSRCLGFCFFESVCVCVVLTE